MSCVVEDANTKEKINLYGQRPKGHLILLPSWRMNGILTGENRKPPRTPEDALAAMQSMAAYSGVYRFEDGKFITKVDIAWDESWVGTEQVRLYRFEGNILNIETAPAVGLVPGLLPGRMVRGILSFVRDA